MVTERQMLRRAVAILVGLTWDGSNHCVSCGMPQAVGHAEGCELHDLVRLWEQRKLEV